MGETEVLAAYLAEAKFEDLPGEVRARAKDSIADTIACGLGGRKTREGDVLVDIMRYLGGRQEGTVIGDRLKLPFMSAIQVNRVICNMLDYDDTSLKAGHMSSALVPVALGIGERLKASGREVINALVLGYEVVSRLRSAVNPSEKAFWTTFERIDTGLNMGVTAIAGKLFGLDAGQMADAVGLAGYVRSSRISTPDRTKKGMPPWMKVTLGDVTIPGIHSVLLAKRGFPGDRTLLDQGRGYEASVGSDRYDTGPLLADLGARYETLRIGYKLFSSCRHTSGPAEAVRALVSEHGIAPDDVEGVVMKGIKSVAENFAIYDPGYMIQCQFSMPYVVAIALLGEPTGPNWYRPELIASPRVRALQRKVTLQEDPVATHRFYAEHVTTSTIEIKMKDGRVLSRHVDYPKGEPENPFSRQDHLEKLHAMAAWAGISRGRADRLARKLERLERLKSIREVMALVVPDGESGRSS